MLDEAAPIVGDQERDQQLASIKDRALAELRKNREVNSNHDKLLEALKQSAKLNELRYPKGEDWELEESWVGTILLALRQSQIPLDSNLPLVLDKLSATINGMMNSSAHEKARQVLTNVFIALKTALSV